MLTRSTLRSTVRRFGMDRDRGAPYHYAVSRSQPNDMNDNSTIATTPLYIIRRADPDGRVYFGLGGNWTDRLALAYRYEDRDKVRAFAGKLRAGLGTDVKVRRLRSKPVERKEAA
jgi:hypothetical protein